MKDFPKYYDVNDTLVKVDHDPKTDEVFGKSAGGGDYSPTKCLVEGYLVSEEEFNREVKRLSAAA